MAKDPAFLFYPGVWVGGTMGMTFEEKGAYIELLMLQFHRGHMTSHMIAQTVGQIWDNVKDKFIQDEEGRWYNQRLEIEKQKRMAFTASRLNNKKGVNQHTKKSPHMRGHMTSHMENVNENINKDKSRDIKDPSEKKLTLAEVKLEFPEFYANTKLMPLFREWKDQRRMKKKPVTPSAERKAIMDIKKHSKGDLKLALQIVQKTVHKGWDGFFPYSEDQTALPANGSAHKQELPEKFEGKW